MEGLKPFDGAETEAAKKRFEFCSCFACAACAVCAVCACAACVHAETFAQSDDHTEFETCDLASPLEAAASTVSTHRPGRFRKGRIFAVFASFSESPHFSRFSMVCEIRG